MESRCPISSVVGISFLLSAVYAPLGCSGDGDGDRSSDPDSGQIQDTSVVDAGEKDPYDPDADSADSDDADGTSADAMKVVPGERVGPISLGMKYEKATEKIGESSRALGMNGRILASYPDRNLELFLASPKSSSPTPDSKVLAVSAIRPDGGEDSPFTGPATPGMGRDAIEQAVDGKHNTYSGVHFFEAGMSVVYDDESKAERVVVFQSYESKPKPPEMKPAKTQ